MGSRSTLCSEEVAASDVEEYSVHFEVYDTEVSESAGSTPIIKISGLCDDDERAPYLRQYLQRLLAEQRNTGISATSMPKEPEPHRPLSLQDFRNQIVASPEMLSAPVNCRSFQAVPGEGQFALAPGPLYMRKNCSAGDSPDRRSRTSCEFASSSMHTKLFNNNIYAQASFHPSHKAARTFGDRPLVRDFSLAGRASPNYCGNEQCVNQGRQNKTQTNLQGTVRAKCSARAGHSEFDAQGCGSGRCDVGVDNDVRSSIRRAEARGRKRTTIPSRLSEAYRGTSCNPRNATACTYTLDKRNRHRCTPAGRLECSDLDCVEETVTTRHLPAAPAMEIPRRYQRPAPQQRSWGCSDICAVYKVLPPQPSGQDSRWTVPNFRMKAAEEQLKEVYVSPSNKVWVEASSSPLPPTDRFTPDHVMEGRADDPESSDKGAQREKSFEEKQTQTSVLLDGTIFAAMTSFIDWFACACYDLASCFPGVHGHKLNGTRLEDFGRTDPDVWNIVLKLVQERMTSVSLRSIAQKGMFVEGMRGEGECPKDRWPQEVHGLPERLSSSLDVSLGQNIDDASSHDFTHVHSCPRIGGGFHSNLTI